MEQNLLKQETLDDFCNDESAEEKVYMLRKRIRLSTGQSSANRSPYVYKRSYKRKNPIMHLPTELLYKIFSFLPNEELAKSVRLVNHRFRTVAQFLLNVNFRQLLKRLENIKAMIVDSIHHTQDDMEMRCMCKMLGTLELLMFYHNLIKSTLWRYIYFQKPISSLCMYAGSILDLYDTVLRQFVTEPHIIYSPGIVRDYVRPFQCYNPIDYQRFWFKALSKEVKEICSSSKAFALYFDRVSEMPVNTNSLCSGCKILDILDSATDVTRTVISQKLMGNTLVLKVKYYFTNSWFVAFDIPEEKSKLWNEEQRVMYMRLRRIVVSHSEMTMEYNQYKREAMIRAKPTSRIRKPINSVYTGYGEVGEKFFYYGVMNEGAYLNKFEVEDVEQGNGDDVYDVPFLGLDISVELRCPIQLAPCKIIESYEKHNQNLRDTIVSSPRKRLKGLFEMKVDFECLAAEYPRLPTNYCYYLKYQR
ncbi:hypothetical protein AMK59_3295 [Oryctes borbonicus]|uniref:F-box domain-containing protein n=1 Tax=Oryctes borbonicus TaxID=1629725 RepID=A0A0T6B8S9_9SCAR|nr:hypothetical protein AMK59_3295 [Oryctes borbonicus]